MGIVTGSSGCLIIFRNFVVPELPEVSEFYPGSIQFIFYAWGEPRYILLMLLSVLINYSFGLLIERKQQKLLMLVMCGGESADSGLF